ncbi:MAG: TolC family protein, partial [Rhizorhabdus sp.]
MPHVNVPQHFSPYQAALPEDALAHWWLIFGDQQLTSYVEEALAHAPDAQTALAVLNEARAFRSAALAQLGPQGDIGVNVGVQRTTVAGTTLRANQVIYSGSFTPSYELDLFGRRAASRRVADADLQAAAFDYAATRQSLGANVAGDLFEARSNAVRLSQARETLRIASELARLGERRTVAGVGSRVDQASLQAEEATAQAQVHSLTAQLEISSRTLLILLGRGTEQVEAAGVEASLTDLPAVPAAAPATLLV